ncbi:hypothetical protein [Opitutus terrae]|uniref:CobW/HypB/UreG nucleotide-binding domain-containing protein n=1 Tax=Opitutus terrae (strain DSM 11246 / JCM 15787 / PB90-1) TaxID=452637 RepID=B1ZUM4_OPITP|nr:hypothetical protein [Opitutus terrae]ACB74908.1 hypothetical protein Oter_1624 [Opitutus terrae PB90-1]
MNSAEKPLVYLILGTAGSGRRALVADLIEGGLAETDRPAVLVSDAENPETTATPLPRVDYWKWTGALIEGSLPEEATHVFFVTDGRTNPVDQIEVFKPWLEAQGGELARVFCVIDCQLAEKNPPLLAWFDACVHFSDVVLLNRREGVENKWLSDFQGRFKKQFLPTLFEFVKADRVRNPGLVLEPQARRMSHLFDEDQDWMLTDAEGEEVDEQDGTAGDEEVELVPEEDPYLARRAGGRRVKEIPHIAEFLPPR